MKKIKKKPPYIILSYINNYAKYLSMQFKYQDVSNSCLIFFHTKANHIQYFKTFKTKKTTRKIKIDNYMKLEVITKRKNNNEDKTYEWNARRQKIYEVHKMNTNFTRHEKNLKDIDTINFLIQKKCTKNENWK